MPSSERGSLKSFSLSEWDKLARTAVRNSTSFESRFAEAALASDRASMVSSLLEAVFKSSVSPSSIDLLQISDSYQGKDDTLAHKLQSENRLDEAISAAKFESPLYRKLLIQRARQSFSRSEMLCCADDCRKLIQLQKNCDDSSEEDCERDLVDALLMLADCEKLQGSTAEARARMNEAMKRIEKLAGEEGRGGKAELLREFLERKKRLIENRQNGENRERLLMMRRQEKKNLPQVDGKINEFLRCCSDAVDLSHNKEKGRLIQATRNIKPGTVLIVDRPYSFCTNAEALHTNCLNCHTSLLFRDSIKLPCESCRTVQFCSDSCRKQAWDAFHRHECRIFDYFREKSSRRTSSLLAYRTLAAAALQSKNNSAEIDQKFLKLHHDDKNAFDVKSLEKYESQNYKTVFTLETHCNRINLNDNLEKTIHSVFFAKCLISSLHFLESTIKDFDRHLHVLAVALLRYMQSINCNAYEIVENIRNEDTKVLEPRTVGGAIYTSVSLTNHSCYPNIVRHTYPCGTVVVRSTRFIPKGYEILDCYGQHFLENDRRTRRKLLAQKYHFICQCQACSNDWPAKLPSDEFHFKCKKCFKECRKIRNLVECTACGCKTEMSKLCVTLQNSVRNRLTALTKMYEGSYEDALPLLLEHASNVDKLLLEPSLEAVKTQQSIIQCLNAMSCTSI